jgi:hypothetical protein
LLACDHFDKDSKNLLTKLHWELAGIRRNPEPKSDLTAISNCKSVSLHSPFILTDMKPIEKLNELSPNATMQMDNNESSVEINNMQVQLRVDDREVRRRELESKEAL